MENTNKELEYALEHSMDQGCYPDVFTEDIGMDFHLSDKPEYYPSDKPWGHNRRCIIEITSYRGMCWDAVHYYAKIKADGIDICQDEVDEQGNVKTFHVGGYISEEYKNLPYDKRSIWSGTYEIDVCRRLEQKEIDDDPDRWEYYHAGEKTNRFEDVKEVEKIALKVAKARFPKGWEIKVDYNY